MRNEVWRGVYRGYLLGLGSAVILFIIVSLVPLWLYAVSAVVLGLVAGKVMHGIADRTTEKVEERFAKFTD